MGQKRPMECAVHLPKKSLRHICDLATLTNIPCMDARRGVFTPC